MDNKAHAPHEIELPSPAAPLSALSKAELDLHNRFGYHVPRNDADRKAIETSRGLFFDLAVKINALVPDGREKALALTKLQEAAQWANCAIASSWGPALPIAAV